MSDLEFWNYSFDEIQRYDLTANVEYVKKTTKSEKVFYIGHSQGTLQFFARVAEDPSW